MTRCGRRSGHACAKTEQLTTEANEAKLDIKNPNVRADLKTGRVEVVGGGDAATAEERQESERHGEHDGNRHHHAPPQVGDDERGGDVECAGATAFDSDDVAGVVGGELEGPAGGVEVRLVDVRVREEH